MFDGRVAKKAGNYASTWRRDIYVLRDESGNPILGLLGTSHTVAAFGCLQVSSYLGTCSVLVLQGRYAQLPGATKQVRIIPAVKMHRLFHANKVLLSGAQSL